MSSESFVRSFVHCLRSAGIYYYIGYTTLDVLLVTEFLSACCISDITIVNKCSAYGCKSGYKTDNTDSSVTFHAYPRDPELRDKWIRANPRKDFIPSKHSRLYSLHFQPTDFVEVRQDTNQRRRKKKSAVSLRRLLKDGVIPSVFGQAPEYLSRGAQTPRTTTKSSSSSRREAQQQRLRNLEDSFRVADDITDSSLHDIRDRLAAEETLPQGFTITIAGDSLHVFVLRVTDSVLSCPGQFQHALLCTLT